jgi:hypothetical protein
MRKEIKIFSIQLLLVILVLSFFPFSDANSYHDNLQSTNRLPNKSGNDNWWWEPIELLSPEFSTNNYIPEIYVDNGNNIHIVTYSADPLLSSGSDWDIFYKKYDYTTKNWSDLELVSIDSTGMSQHPDIAVNSAGNIHVVWYDSTNYDSSGTDTDIIYRQRTESGWEDIEVVSTESSDSSFAPSIAIDSNDSVHVVWADLTNYIFCGTDRDIFYKEKSSGEEWTTTYVISYESDLTSDYPDLSFDDEDNVLFIWEDEENYGGCGADKDIFFKTLDIDTSLFSPLTVVSSESDLESDEPSISKQCGGDIHVCWTDSSDYNDAGLDDDIFYKKYNLASESWGLTNVISHESTDDSFECDVAADEDENLYVTWRDDTDIGGIGNDDNIYVKYYDLNANSWSSYFVLTFNHESYAGSPEIDVDSLGHVHVIWIDWTDDLLDSGTDSDIFYSKFVGVPGISVLNQITPNPTSVKQNSLNWEPGRDAELFYVYRANSYFTSISGLNPIGVSSSFSYTDYDVTPGTYYYAIVAENRYGQSAISNVESVIVTGLFSSINLGEMIILAAVIIAVQLLVSILFRRKDQRPKNKKDQRTKSKK